MKQITYRILTDALSRTLIFSSSQMPFSRSSFLNVKSGSSCHFPNTTRSMSLKNEKNSIINLVYSHHFIFFISLEQSTRSFLGPHQTFCPAKDCRIFPLHYQINVWPILWKFFAWDLHVLSPWTNCLAMDDCFIGHFEFLPDMSSELRIVWLRSKGGISAFLTFWHAGPSQYYSICRLSAFIILIFSVVFALRS